MSEKSLIKEKCLQHFLANQKLWAASIVATWIVFCALLLTFGAILENRKSDNVGRVWALWEPFSWYFSSAFMIFIMYPIVAYAADFSKQRYSWQRACAFHLAMTVPFCIVHVIGIIVIRELCYAIAGWDYEFGNLVYGFTYEYIHDVIMYFMIIIFVYNFRFIALRLQGEAFEISEREKETFGSEEKPAERFLVKKLGKEFLIPVSDIQWVEASGNYANLHTDEGIYPMRITMTKLEKCLPKSIFSRVHRSSIVNVGLVENVVALETGDYSLLLKNGGELSLSRRYRESFKERFQYA